MRVPANAHETAERSVFVRVDHAGSGVPRHVAHVVLMSQERVPVHPIPYALAAQMIDLPPHPLPTAQMSTFSFNKIQWSRGHVVQAIEVGAEREARRHALGKELKSGARKRAVDEWRLSCNALRRGCARRVPAGTLSSDEASKNAVGRSRMAAAI